MRIMGYNKSPLAFDDIREVFDKALAATRGVKITCETRAAAVNLRARFNYFRKIHRAESRLVYKSTDLEYGRTPYDALQLRLSPKGDPQERVLYIEKRLAGDLSVEEIIEEVGKEQTNG